MLHLIDESLEAFLRATRQRAECVAERDGIVLPDRTSDWAALLYMALIACIFLPWGMAPDGAPWLAHAAGLVLYLAKLGAGSGSGGIPAPARGPGHMRDSDRSRADK